MKTRKICEDARPAATGGGRFRARISKLATGEIRLRMSPVAAGSLDQERKLQELYTGDIERLRDSLPKVGHGSLAVSPSTGELRRPVFSSRGKSTLREFGAVLDERFGRNAVFFTLTLPSSTDEAKRALAEQSSYVVARVTQWLRDRLRDAWYGWVWEFQRRGALHLHLVVGDDDYFGLVLLLLNWRDFAYDLLQTVETRSSCDLLTYYKAGRPSRERDYVQMDAVFVQHSAARYLAKYMGKARPDGLANEPYYPARWWRVSNRALAAIREKREYIELRGESAESIKHAAEIIIGAVATVAGEIRQYANKMFPWLQNYICYHDTADGAARMWQCALDTLAVVPCLALCTRDYGISSGGGGGTNPRHTGGLEAWATGVPPGRADEVPLWSEILTFMNSIRSTSISTA